VAIDGGSVTLADDTVLAADLVVLGVGVKPRLDLARAAGCAVDAHGGGVLVDDRLRTSVPGIWAAGDAAGWPDARTGERRRVEHWVVAQRQGQTAAKNMLGGDVRFDAAPFFWSAHYDVAIAYVGHADPLRADVVIEGNLAERDAKVTYSVDGEVRAVATIFRDLDSLRAEVELEGA
jgi:NADPH-dependent 2,4-dienoyl-CoA reductase/sulfur reductase-like enzyme